MVFLSENLLLTDWAAGASRALWRRSPRAVCSWHGGRWVVRPLYYGRTEGGALAFASEVKALLAVTEDVHEFPPGTWYTASEGFHRYATVESGRLPEGDPDRIALELRHRLDQAVARCVVADEMGTWLSGGVDSSVIATVAWPRVRTLHSFVSGVKGAPDLAYGEQMATFLGTVHHSLLVTREDLAAALPEVIYHLESFDALLVRSSVVNYLTAQLASDYVSAVLSGEGGDELLVGYDYIKQVPPSAIPAEVEDIVMRLHNTALQRVDRCAYAHGLVPHIPFADMDVVRYALRIPAEHKIRRLGGTAIEKWILRRAFQGLLPDAVLWRPRPSSGRAQGWKRSLPSTPRRSSRTRTSDVSACSPTGGSFIARKSSSTTASSASTSGRSRTSTGWGEPNVCPAVRSQPRRRDNVLCEIVLIRAATKRRLHPLRVRPYPPRGRPRGNPVTGCIYWFTVAEVDSVDTGVEKG